MANNAADWDVRYADGRIWSAEPNRFFAGVVEELAARPGTAIDLACGEGRNAVWLAARGWNVTAVDFSTVGIDRGRRGADDAGLELDWIVADLADWDVGTRCWDLVAHVYLHWPTEQREPFIDRCAEALAPGGHLVIVGHDRFNIEHGHGGPQNPDVLTTPSELADQLGRAGLEVVRAETVLRPVAAEPGHGRTGSDTPVVDAIDHVVVARRPD